MTGLLFRCRGSIEEVERNRVDFQRIGRRRAVGVEDHQVDGESGRAVVGEAFDAQRAVGQFAIPDGKILSLPNKINKAIGQIEIDSYFRVLGQESIEDGNDVAPAKVDRQRRQR